MLLDTLRWREEYKPENITWETVEGEAKLGKVFILENSDNEGRPVVFMRPRNEVPGGDNDVKLKWVVYIMEHASRIADASSPDGKMAWLLDYVGYNRQNQPPWKVSLSTLSIVQNHYPERLGKAVNFKPPLLFEIFWKAIRPFVDPVTREKLVFLNGKDMQVATTEMAKYFDLKHLDEAICGQLPEGDMYNYESFHQRMDAADKAFTAKLEEIRSS
jgi:polyribonucleotide 5'-hydroxyl-kinase